MADRSTQLVLDALGRAAAEPAGLPLCGTKAAPGLFPTTAAGRQAAQRAREEGWLQVDHTESRGKKVVEHCVITDKGLDHLLAAASPRHVLEDFVRALEARQNQTGQLLAAARETQAGVTALRAAAEMVLHRLADPREGQAAATAGPRSWTATVLDHLAGWQATRTSEDCPLPELYHQAKLASPGLSIGRFHDGLRRLHDQEQIYLHPWTGPLYDLPEPPYALLVGHEIAYYASRRCA